MQIIFIGKMFKEEVSSALREKGEKQLQNKFKSI
jgi:hypothetical protein